MLDSLDKSSHQVFFTTYHFHSSKLKLLIAVIFAILVFFISDFFMGLATLSYSMLIIGLLNRFRSKHEHAFFMTLGISIDLIIVLSLEIQRNAIGTAVSFSLSSLQQAHIGFSSLATLLYFPVLFLGVRNLKSPPTLVSLKAHKILGYSAFIFRSLGFVLMFSLIGLKK